MLTTHKKAMILTRAGIDVPPCPTPLLCHGLENSHHSQLDVLKERECAAEHARLMSRWNHEVTILYAGYTACRAAKTLRDAEAARQLIMLRIANR